MTLERLQVKVFKAEKKLFDTFNALNSDDQYDVHCDHHSPKPKPQAPELS